MNPQDYCLCLKPYMVRRRGKLACKFCGKNLNLEEFEY